jgi:tape measure domain-containing protein
MANKLGYLTIGIAADVASLRKDMKQAQSTVKGSMDKISRSARSARNSIAGLAAGIISVRGFRSLVRYSDEYTNLNNRLKLAANSSAEFAKSQGLVFDIAQDTRQALGSTAELYQRLALSTKELGLSQADLGDIVKTVNQSLVISGASSQAASAAIVQLGQGLAAGALRGQEFNSIAEQAPRLMQALADSLGVNIGKLREYSKEGKLTAKVIVDALKGQSKIIAEEFNNTQLTVDQSLQKIQNSFTKLFGEGLEGAGATRELTEALAEFNKLISDPAFASALVSLAAAVVKITAGFVKLAAAVPLATKELAEFSAAKFGAPDVSAAIKDIESLQLLSANLANSPEIKSRVGNQQRIIEGLIGFSSVEQLEQYLQRVTLLVHQTAFAIGDGVNDENDKAFLKLYQDTRDVIVDAVKAKEELQGSAVEIPKPEEIAPPAINKDFLKEQEKQLKQLKSALKSAQPPLKKYLDDVAVAKSLLQAGKLEQHEYNNALTIYKQRLDESTGANNQWKKDVEDAAKFAALATTEVEKLEKELESLYALAERDKDRKLISDETVKRNAERIKKDMEGIKEAAKEIDDIGAALAQGMQDVVRDGFVSIWKGGFDEVLDNFGQLLINLALEAAAADVVAAIGFGGKDNKGGNLASLANALFSFEGGGFTGAGSRTGGLDGRGGFLSVLHPNETVVDHTRGQSVGRVASVVNHFHKVPNQREANRAAGQIARGISNGVSGGRRYT